MKESIHQKLAITVEKKNIKYVFFKVFDPKTQTLLTDQQSVMEVNPV